ncbi:tyrosine-type recombinase/integrase [Polynucleobacter nymphae]|uniref:tyrosine-type recombinase/integrase n=1 Tax=Polynucleobacter nymphae TaxID=2081043 RepID=UPI001C0B331E|nr:site-specific integrase [Polynucleobacter nymphae]MBU3607496.1 site-specific integrase [Polynucleobacter nymphae]
MTLKKKTFSEEEILIYDEAVIYKRGDIWQFRYWLEKERRYVRLSLKTKNIDVAIEKAKKHFVKIKSETDSGKTYYSKTAKDGVLMYLEYRKGHIESRTTKSIVKGRYGTIRSHLDHWLDFIERDTKLKELDRDSCADYAKTRENPSATKTIALSTIAGEQSTINSMMKWLHKKGEVYIDGFDFETISIRNTPEEAVRRSSFTDEEVWAFRLAIPKYIEEAMKDLTDLENKARVLSGHYLLISSICGLRTGEQKQLKWKDITFQNQTINKEEIDFIKINVRKETSKVRKSRVVKIRDMEYFQNLFNLTTPTHSKQLYGENFIFSFNGINVVSQRAVTHHFKKILEAAEIDVGKRKLVPYSFRHYFITNRIKAGLSYKAVADMCGTSRAQIEKTYYHIDEDILTTQAMAGYYTIDGMIVPT